MMVSLLSSGKFSQNSEGGHKHPRQRRDPGRGGKAPRRRGSSLTFHLVGGGRPDLGLAVLQEVLEGWDQVVLGDLGAHGLLELQKREGFRTIRKSLNIDRQRLHIL